MTRIVAGSAGGRTLVVPKGATRPTSERVREALFSRLDHQGVLAGARVLDLFAGSGALGLEAASRGACEVTLVESARPAVQACHRNIATLGLGGVTVVGSTVGSYLAGEPAATYDLVLIDPPYDIAEQDVDELLTDLARWLSPGAVVVLERARRSPEPSWPDHLEPTGERRYGDTVLWFAAAA